MIKFLETLWDMARPYKFRLMLGVLTGFLAGVAEPLLLVTAVFVFKVVFPSAVDQSLNQQLQSLPGFLRHVLEQMQAWAPSAQGKSTALMVGVILLIPAVTLLRGALTYLHAYLMNWVAVRAISDLRARFFEHLLNMPLSFFSQTSTGELMSRVGDVATLQNMITNFLPIIIKEPVTVLSWASLLFMQETTARLALVAILVSPICIIPIVIYSRKVRTSSAAIQTNYAELARMLHESFSGNRIIKAYNLEKIVVDQFKGGLRKFIGHYMRVVRSQEIPGPLMEFVGSIGVAIILIFVASRAPGTTMTGFFTFVICIFAMYKPLKAIIRLHSQVEQARAASQRVFQLLELRTNVIETAVPKQLQARGADISFVGVDFDYGEKPILRGIELSVKAGQLVALVGRTGSGKTTITNLLLRFYDPQRGEVRIGPVNLREVSLRELRNQIAVVTQDTILFNDTIRRNIELGRPGATAEEIEGAARHANAHDFILQQPAGYDTLIGERGVNLSGGQRQRLAIARAVLKNAPILILDEATSSLDTEAERAVQEALEGLMQGRTTICIAHRLSTIQNADVIVVMDHGRIVETGRHAELLQRNGIYKKLHELQFQE